MLADLVGLDVPEGGARHLPGLRVLDRLDHGIQEERDLRVLASALLHDLRGPQRVAAMHDLHLAAEAGQVERLLHRRIAAADHHDVLVLEEEAVAGRARGEAATHQRALLRQVQRAGGGSGGDDHGLGLVGRALRADHERVAGEVHARHVLGDHVGAEALGLLAHRLHEVGADDAVHEAGIVLDQRGQHELPAGLHTREHERRQIAPGRVDGRRVAGRPGADDDHLARRRHRSRTSSSLQMQEQGQTMRLRTGRRSPPGRRDRGSRRSGARSLAAADRGPG